MKENVGETCCRCPNNTCSTCAGKFIDNVWLWYFTTQCHNYSQLKAAINQLPAFQENAASLTASTPAHADVRDVQLQDVHMLSTWTGNGANVHVLIDCVAVFLTYSIPMLVCVDVHRIVVYAGHHSPTAKSCASVSVPSVKPVLLDKYGAPNNVDASVSLGDLVNPLKFLTAGSANVGALLCRYAFARKSLIMEHANAGVLKRSHALGTRGLTVRPAGASAHSLGLSVPRHRSLIIVIAYASVLMKALPVLKVESLIEILVCVVVLKYQNAQGINSSMTVLANVSVLL